MLNRAAAALVMVSVVVACQTTRRSGSGVQVAGGTEVTDAQYPEVISFASENGPIFAESCTGVFITPRVILTAAHCVWKQADTRLGLVGPGSDLGDFEDLPHKRIPNPYADDIAELEENPGTRVITFSLANEPEKKRRTSCFFVTPGWVLGSGGPGSRQDLAAVIVGEADRSQHVTALTGKRPEVGAPATYVGYGWDKQFGVDHGIKRMATTPLREVSSDGVLLTYAEVGGAPMVREGDSGGPMYVNGQLVGIASAVQARAKRKLCENESCRDVEVDVGFHVDLADARTRSFLDKILAVVSSGTLDTNTGNGCAPRNRATFIKSLQNKSYLGGI